MHCSICRRVPNPAMDPFADMPPARRPPVVSCQVWLSTVSGVCALHSATHLLEGETSHLIVNAHVPAEAEARHLQASAVTGCVEAPGAAPHARSCVFLLYHRQFRRMASASTCEQHAAVGRHSEQVCFQHVAASIGRPHDGCVRRCCCLRRAAPAFNASTGAACNIAMKGCGDLC